jgi:hypothetical protein
MYGQAHSQAGRLRRRQSRLNGGPGRRPGRRLSLRVTEQTSVTVTVTATARTPARGDSPGCPAATVTHRATAGPAEQRRAAAASGWAAGPGWGRRHRVKFFPGTAWPGPGGSPSQPVHMTRQAGVVRLGDRAVTPGRSVPAESVQVRYRDAAAVSAKLSLSPGGPGVCGPTGDSDHGGPG